MKQVGTGRYREMSAVAHLPGLLCWALGGRLHLACTSLAITFLIVDWTGSSTLAGVVVGVLTLCRSLAGHWWGRSAHRGHIVGLMVLTSSGYATGLAGTAASPPLLRPAGWPVAVAPAAVNGFALSPVSQVARAGGTRLVPSPLRDTVYTVDAALQEPLSVIGPLMIAATVAVAGPASGVLGVAGFVLIGGLAALLLALAVGIVTVAGGGGSGRRARS